MKLTVVLPAFEMAGQETGQAITYDTYDIFAKISEDTDTEIDFVFVFEGFSDPKKVKAVYCRDNRGDIMARIRATEPEAVLCLGKQSIMAVLGNGSITIDQARRKHHSVEELGDVPVWASFSLEQVYYRRGYADWIARDVLACMAGQTAVEIPEYVVSQDQPDHWPLEGGSVVGFDLETYPGLDPWHPESRIRMAVFTDHTGHTQIVRPNDDGLFPKWLREFMADPQYVKTGSNIKFDHSWCARFGMDLANMVDTSTTAHVLDEQQPLKDLKSLALMYAPELGAYNAEQERRVRERGGWEHVTDEEMLDYAACDGIASYKSGVALMDSVVETGNDIPFKISRETYRVLGGMEHNGICIDRKVLDELDELYSDRLSDLRKQLYADFGPINPNSPTQLMQAILKVCPGIDLRRNQRSAWLDDEYSTNRMVLERESDKYPILRPLMEYRTLSKRHGTYVTGMRERLVRHDGSDNWFVHGRFRTDVVETFRLSSADPNLQNIPRNFADDDLAELNVKRMFVSRFPGGSIMEADESQLELRIAAELSQDSNWLDAFARGEDIHAATATQVFGDAEGEHRQIAKMVNFLVLYQGGARKLALALGTTQRKAQAIINAYFDALPAVQSWIEMTKLNVHETLESTNIFGYKRRFIEPFDWNTKLGFSIERKAVNTPIQGGAGVLVQIALQQLCDEMEERKLRSVPIITVHDSAVIDVCPGEEQVVAEIAKRHLEQPDTERYGVSIGVPLVADIAIGDSWASKTNMEI